MKKIVVFFFLQIIIIAAIAQSPAAKPKLKGWHLLNLQEDGYLGTGVKEAYELLKNRKSSTVTIAVIDSGIDTLHEDLKDNLWVNKEEIGGNGIDDDKNGYIDDMYGWNFCGLPNGENMATNSNEITRVYHTWKNEFQGKKESEIPAGRKFLFAQWKRSFSLLSKQYEEYKQGFANIDNTQNVLSTTNRLIVSLINKPDFTKTSLPVRKMQDSIGWAIAVWNDVFGNINDTSVKNTAVLKDVDDYRNRLLTYKKKMEEPPQDFRALTIKDNYLDFNDKFYGNNNLKTGSGNHGTHVSGIIGAVHNNNKGVDGIVENVRIMAIRAMPGGDEYDKDVALAIRYAVDNGAQIINMSFGKPVSPYKQLVDDAVKYAAAKNVLLVHGSGNDGQNLDQDPFYPSKYFIDSTAAVNMLTVGASGDYSTTRLAADFSNYSSTQVDIFAPGVYINSTITGNGYDAFDGTSMASPVAAGVAGLLKSYFPKLTPQQIIDVIMESGTAIKEQVVKPGTKDTMVSFDKLCKSGKIINAYEAVKLALKKFGN